MSHVFDMSIPAGYWVDDEDSARKWMQYFLSSYKVNGGLGLDTETTGLDIVKDRVIVWSLSDGVQRICLPAKYLMLFKEPILENPDIDLDFSNAKFDAHMIANMGVDVSKAGEWRNTIVQSWLNNENNTGRHGLKECITDHFNRVTPTFEQVFGKVPPKRRDKKTGLVISKTVGDLINEAFGDVSRKIGAADYASLDSFNATVLRAHFDDLLSKVNMGHMSLAQYFYKVEVPFTKVLWKMERRGITVDRGYLQTRQGPMEKEMDTIREEFSHATTELSGEPRMLNLNSVYDVRYFFYDLLKKEVTHWTDGGTTGNKQPSTDADTLDEWAGQGDPWARKLVRYRSISKIYGTYVMGLQEWIDPLSKIHTTFSQTGAVTGRLSSRDPNLMNIPRPGEDEYKIREGFINSELMRLIVADYEQIEMRLMAHFSGDLKMIEAINKGIDIHCLTVSEMNGIPYDEVKAAKKAEGLVKEGKRLEPLTPREQELLLARQGAKATGFGIIYGIGGRLLAANLTKDTGHLLTEDEGNSLIDKWFGVFPGVKKHIDRRKNDLWKYGYIQTILGRFRRFGDFKSMSKRDRSQAERQGVNAEIQGSAADIAKLAMIQIEGNSDLKKMNYSMLLQVHDEVVGECPDDPEIVEQSKAIVKSIMENALGVPLSVKTPVSISSGYDWASAK